MGANTVHFLTRLLISANENITDIRYTLTITECGFSVISLIWFWIYYFHQLEMEIRNEK
jgi:hypothetical protein